MKSYIVCCSCFNMAKRASQAFSTMFPNDILPPIVKGRDRVYKLSQELRNEHIKAISRLSGKYAYYIEVDGDTITKEYDLVHSKRIA